MKIKNPFKPRAAEEDFSVSKLPHNRKEVFFDVMKINWRAFVGYGLCMLLFSLPSLFTAMAEDVITMSLMSSCDTATAEGQADILAQIITIKNTRAAIDIISYLVLSVGIAGMIRVIRQHAWGEPVFFLEEFRVGIKQNAKQMSVVGLLFGIINLLNVYAYNFSAVTTDRWVAIIGILAVDVLSIVGVPVLMYSAASICVYDKSLKGHIISSLALTAKAPFKTLLAIICCLIPFVIQLIPISYCHIFGRIISGILMPFVIFGWTLFAFDRFDEFINKKNHTELVGKGTFPIPDKEGNDEEGQSI